jgi:hypothetical protein
MVKTFFKMSEVVLIEAIVCSCYGTARYCTDNIDIGKNAKRVELSKCSEMKGCGSVASSGK